MPIKNVHLDDVGEEVVRYTDTCRAEGCGKKYASNGVGYGRGYCPNHYALWLRNGEPRPMREIRREAFHRAIFRYMEDPSQENRHAVCLAGFAAKFRTMKEDPGPDFGLIVASRVGQKLIDAAVTWADFDAEAPLAAFKEASVALDKACDSIRAAVARYRLIASIGRDEYDRQARERARNKYSRDRAVRAVRKASSESGLSEAA